MKKIGTKVDIITVTYGGHGNFRGVLISRFTGSHIIFTPSNINA